MIALAEKRALLEESGFAYGFDREVYYNRDKMKVFSIEFVEDRQGRRYTYDINGTTNYNSVLGREVGVDGMREVARYLRKITGSQVLGRRTRTSRERAA